MNINSTFTSFYPQIGPPSRKFINPNPFKLFCPLPKFHFSFKSSQFYRILASTPISHISTQNLSWVNSSLEPQKRISKFLSEKIVIFLVGSFVVMGSFNVRPSLALPVQTTSSDGAKMEEEEIIRNEGSGNEAMWEKILESDPKNIEALKVVFYGKMSRGKTKDAVDYVERLIGLEPEEIEWRLLQALCYEMMGRLSTAKRLFKEILEKKPLLLRALHGLAMVMHKNHESPAAFELLNKALQMSRDQKRVTEERNIRILIAQMHVLEGELEVGLKKFQDLVHEDPRDFRPYLCQCIIYSLLGKEEEAAEQFETYRSLVPEEFPQRGFLDDVMLTARTKSREQLKKEFTAEFSYKQ